MPDEDRPLDEEGPAASDRADADALSEPERPQDLNGVDAAEPDTRERDILLGDEPADDDLPPVPPNPARTVVLGAAALGAVILALYMVWRHVIAPPEQTPTTQVAATQPVVPRLPDKVGPQFEDVTDAAGLVVNTRMGDASSRKQFITEAKGGGIAFLDYDGDGWLDVYVVNAGPLTPVADAEPIGNILMRNRGDGAFEDVTDTAGVGHTGYGIGVCAGDFDNDGHLDLYVTNLGPNVLYRNRGDGTFEDVTAAAGVAGDAYSVGAAFLDYDLDGDLDLFVGNYVTVGPDVKPMSGRWKGGAVYFGPRGLPGVPDVLYRNNGDGTFADVSAASGVGAAPSRSLGVVAGDADGDGRPDVLVAGDREPNRYYHNQGDGTFKESGLLSGLAYAERGSAFGSQGIDLADLDNDRRMDVVVGNFADQAPSVYLGYPKNLWLDVATRVALRGPWSAFCTFGVAICDYDNDGDKDVVTANGHTYPDVDRIESLAAYGQPTAIFHNRGPEGFLVLTRHAGKDVDARLPSRGLAVGDYDNDGDLDIVMATIDRPPLLLRNGGTSGAGSVLVRLRGTTCNRSAIGARVTAKVRLDRQVVEIKSGSGFASQSDLRAHFGLGDAPAIDVLTVTWPGGAAATARDVPAGSLVTAVEGEEITWAPLVKADATDDGEGAP